MLLEGEKVCLATLLWFVENERQEQGVSSLG